MFMLIDKRYVIVCFWKVIVLLYMMELCVFQFTTSQILFPFVYQTI